MPFYLYRKTPINGDSQYIQERKISLAGKNNVIYGALTATNQLQKNRGQNAAIGWHLSESDLLRTATDQYLSESVLPDEYAIVIDLKPSVNVSLYEIKDIWGFSYPDYTPIALRLETLFVDHEPKNSNPDAFKKCFKDNNCFRKQVHEFLYLRGGYNCGTWHWGQVGSVNGALLWPEALEFFFEKIKPYFLSITNY